MFADFEENDGEDRAEDRVSLGDAGVRYTVVDDGKYGRCEHGWENGCE